MRIFRSLALHPHLRAHGGHAAEGLAPTDVRSAGDAGGCGCLAAQRWVAEFDDGPALDGTAALSRISKGFVHSSLLAAIFRGFFLNGAPPFGIGVAVNSPS